MGNFLRTNTILFAAALAGVLMIPAVTQAGDSKSLEALAAESASTPEQHAALASYYREKATEASNEVKNHREMALSYSSKGAGSAAGMKAHCDNLAKAAETEAAQYTALAEFHDAESKKAAR